MVINIHNHDIENKMNDDFKEHMDSILVHCQIYQIFVNIDVPHASKYDQIMSIISDCEETDASVMTYLIQIIEIHSNTF